MNNCPNCKLLISCQDYCYCPYCRHVIRELELSCPEKVFAGTSFLVVCSAKGTESVTLRSVMLDGELIERGEVQINPESSKIFELRIDEPGLHTLIVKTNGPELSQTIRCSNLGYFSLSWQNIQVLDLNDLDSEKRVYVTKELTDHNILLTYNTRSWFEVKRVSILVSGTEFNCTQGISGHEIPSSFFDMLARDKTLSGELRVASTSNHLIRMPNLQFIHTPEMPDIRLINSDYANAAPLSESNNVMSFVLSYNLYDSDSVRLLNNLRVKFLSDFIDEKFVDSYFDDEQKIHHNVEINLARLRGADSSNDITARLELHALFELPTCETVFCRYFDIPFIVKNHNGIYHKDINKVVAIDFGTSNTCIAYVDEGGETVLWQEPTILKFYKFNQFPPHSITFGQDVGNDDPPLTFATNFKPRLTRDEELYYFDRQTPKNIQALRPSALARLYLTNALDRLFLNTDSKPGKALISYPADFPTETRRRVHEIIDSLGINSDSSRTLTEPENIALYFALEPGSPIRDKINSTSSATICVFDCGGGTTDVSVVRVTQDDQISFEILATWGTDRFSGNYITYMIGMSINGEADWFPKDFSLLYTAKNEELEQYFQQVQHYEAIKCNSLGAYTEQMQYTNLESSIRREIRSLFDMIDENILYRMFMNNILDKTNPDFFILAGNSCRLSIFNEEAKECYPDSNIIWVPEDGKKAVAKGALKAHELVGSLNIKGASKSKNEYLYRHGLETITLFEPLLDMCEGGYAVSNHVNPTGIPILGRHMIDGPQKVPVIKFTIPPPSTTKKGFAYRFKLRFVNKTFYYAWVAENGDQIEETELEAITNFTEN